MKRNKFVYAENELEGKKMSIQKTKFGEYGGTDVYCYTLDNAKGLRAEILTLGGIVKKLIYNGVDVVLGRDTLEEYCSNEGYFGALIGRNANRIENASFDLNGQSYTLFANDGANNLHGGKIGFDKKVWGAECIDAAEPSLMLTLTSPDGEEGFPAAVDVKVTYTLTADNAIRIHYEGTADSDTVLNMTNHTYFNLNGHDSGTVDGHSLWLDSNFYTPNTAACIPNGEIQNVQNTPFDFRTAKTLGEGFQSQHEQIKLFGGFDHNFALSGRGYRLAGKLTGDKTGITMEFYTDQSGVQLYTGNVIEEGRKCKDGAVYTKHSALCLETQAFPNSLKFSHFPSAILKKGEKYDTVTTYQFI